MLNDGVVKRERENGRMKWREASPRKKSCGLRQVENSLRYWEMKSWEDRSDAPGGKAGNGKVLDAHEEGQGSEKMLWDVGRWPREGP